MQHAISKFMFTVGADLGLAWKHQYDPPTITWLEGPCASMRDLLLASNLRYPQRIVSLLPVRAITRTRKDRHYRCSVVTGNVPQEAFLSFKETGDESWRSFPLLKNRRGPMQPQHLKRAKSRETCRTLRRTDSRRSEQMSFLSPLPFKY